MILYKKAAARTVQQPFSVCGCKGLLLLLGSLESNSGSTGSGVHTLQRDGSHLVVQGVKALGVAVLGGELQNVDNVSLLVSLDIAGDDDALAVSQTLACQVLALVLRACIVQR